MGLFIKLYRTRGITSKFFGWRICLAEFCNRYAFRVKSNRSGELIKSKVFLKLLKNLTFPVILWVENCENDSTCLVELIRYLVVRFNHFNSMYQNLTCILTALLTFGFGMLASELLSRVATGIEARPTSNVETYVAPPSFRSTKRETKYGCESEDLERVWEELNLDALMELKRREIWVSTMHSEFASKPSKERYEADLAEFQRKGLNCSVFKSIDDEIDLNGDGDTELVVRGRISSNRGDIESYIFQKVDGNWKPILFDGGSVEFEVQGKRTFGYSDLRFKTMWFTGGGRMISNYKFNGIAYVPSKCYLVEGPTGEMEIERPALTKAKCNPLDALLR